MSGVNYQPPRIPYIEEGSGNGFNWNFFAKSGTTTANTQYLFIKKPSWSELIGKQFYWYSFGNEFYRIKS